MFSLEVSKKILFYHFGIEIVENNIPQKVRHFEFFLDL